LIIYYKYHYVFHNGVQDTKQLIKILSTSLNLQKKQNGEQWVRPS